jgi:hypothetical protein
MTVEKKDTKTVEKKDDKKINREELLKQAEGLGIDVKGLSDDQLLFKLVTELNKTTSELAATMARSDEKTLKKYVGGIKTELTDEEFLLRLMNLSIPSYYLHLFKNEDSTKKDVELWTMINKSGINPFKSLKEIIKATQKYNAPVMG